MANPTSNTKTYFISVAILPQKEGFDLPKRIQMVAGIFSDISGIINTLYEFKVCGEPTLIFIINISDTVGFERTIAPLWQQGAVHVECQPVISYESFARSIKVSESLARPGNTRLAKDGLYWLDFDVDYHGKTTDKLVKIWKKEAESLFTARRSGGASIELYKCVAQRQVHAFMNAPSPGYLDALSLQLPLMRENGENVKLKCKAVQFLEDYTSSIASYSI